MLGLAGCAGEVEPAVGDGEDELKAQTLKLVGTGGLSAMDTPTLKTGAQGGLVCERGFVVDGRERLTCRRGAELLEVVLRPADKQAIVVHRPAGRATDQRTFFACTTSGNGPGNLPASLRCTKKTPTSASGHGGLASPFAPTFPGIRIQNAHAVGSGGLLVRAMAPHSEDDYDDLAAAGVGAALVFKNQTGKDNVADEIAELTKRGIPASRTASIPFKWKDIGPFEEPCKQTVEALKFIATNIGAGKKTFFHCTVGEDRTGLLAAVHRLLNEPSLTAEEAWDTEMCERGYGAGNPLKPTFVTGQLDDGLTPLYRSLAWLVAKGRLSNASLDPSVCKSDPSTDAAFAGSAVPAARLSCGMSTRFDL